MFLRYRLREVVLMATKSFITDHKFSRKSAVKLLNALESSDDKNKDVLAPPNNVHYVKRTDKESFEKFLRKTIN